MRVIAHALAVLASVGLVGGCFERGKKRERARDAAVVTAPAIDAAPIARGDPRGPADPLATIRIRLEAEPAHLNPALGDSLAARVLLGDVYEGLVCRARELDPPRACLASRWEVSEDHKRYTFHLRSGVRFHDGRPLTAADVIYSLELVARSGAPTWLRADFDDLASVRADGRDVVVEFEGFRRGRLEAFARLPILPRHRFAGASPARLATHPASRSPVGTGPLAFESYQRGERITLVRNPDYWGRSARVAQIVYEIIPSRERAFAKLRAGSLDLAPQLPLGEARDLANERDLELFSYERPAYLAAVYNSRKSLLTTRERRRAMTSLLDRRELVRTLFDNRARVITGPFIGDDVNPSVVPIPFDRVAARREIPHGARLEILVPAESKTMAQIADIWASDAAGIVELVPRLAPYMAVLERTRAGEFDIALLAFTTGTDVDMYHRLHTSQIGAENIGGLNDRALDARLVEARLEVSDERRRRITHLIHARIAALQPYAFIASDVRAGVVGRDIGGISAGDGLAARLLWRRSRPE